MAAQKEYQHILLEIINTSSAEEMAVLARMIKKTEITFGHDQIILTWKSRCRLVKLGNQDFGVPNYIHLQKRNSLENRQGLNIESFSREAELLLNLLRLIPDGSKEGMDFWGRTLRNQLLKIQGMIEDSFVEW